MATTADPNVRLDAFYAQVKQQGLHPAWLSQNPVAPRADVRPWLWPWSAVRARMFESAEVMPLGVDGGADRRVLTMVNPSLSSRSSDDKRSRNSPPKAMTPSRLFSSASLRRKPCDGNALPTPRGFTALLGRLRVA